MIIPALALLALLDASLAVAQDAALTFHPAHWVEGDEIEPTWEVSPFQAMEFTSPSEGWLAGERYVLHIQGERLEVAFVDIRQSLKNFGFSSPTIGWAATRGEENGPLLSYRDGIWRRERPAGIDWPYWGVINIMAGRAGEAWATTWFGWEARRRPTDKWSRGLLHHDESGWAPDARPAAGRNPGSLSDACQGPDGKWWFVGGDFSAPSGSAVVLARWDGNTLEPVAGPASDSEVSWLGAVRCLPDGSAWAVGRTRPAKGQPADILVMRYTTRWERIPVPAFFPREPTADALAPVSADEAWFAASCGFALQPECCSRFLHYREGRWETVGVPLMPGGRCTKVAIDQMQFVSPDEGWAIADDLEPYLGIGRIFHYKNGTWRLRNWNWHFWDAPWFNLFG
ncbi:MAG: hypothetical protein U0802_17510 [Candidatus Binatia bacterium]